MLYFYPKDDTPGCTRQARSIRDNWGEFERPGSPCTASVPTRPSRTSGSEQKYGLPFPLLADPDHSMAEAYGAWVEKKNYGKTYMGIERSAFVIDADGNLVAAKRRIKPEHTASWALGEVARLGDAART